MAWTSKEKQNAYWQKVGPKYNLSFRQSYKEDPNFRASVLAARKQWRKANPEKCQRMYRKQASKRLGLRFDIFKRDHFSCVYCGRSAPTVVLQIDHIIAKAVGGTDRSENYVTACADCNVGKSDKLLA